MNTFTFTAGHGLMLASPRLRGDGAGSAVSISLAPRNTGATTL